jgi:hypothetical protein
MILKIKNYAYLCKIEMTLDLHGVKHADVDVMVEDFILGHITPLYIIVGNSNVMRDKVLKILLKHDFKWVIKSHNLGEIIVL